MHINSKLASCVLALLAPVTFADAASADENETALAFDYSYVEIQFLHTNFNTDEFTLEAAGTTGTFTDATSNGFGIAGAYGQALGASDLVGYVAGDFMSYDAELGVALQGGINGNGIAPVQFREWRIAAGIAFEATDWLALNAEAGYLNTDVTFEGINGLGAQIGLNTLNLEGQGLDLRTGFRAKTSARTEVFGFVRYNPNGKIENTGLDEIGFTDEIRFTAGARYRITENVSFGASYEFGEPGTVRLSARFSF